MQTPSSFIPFETNVQIVHYALHDNVPSSVSLSQKTAGNANTAANISEANFW